MADPVTITSLNTIRIGDFVIPLDDGWASFLADHISSLVPRNAEAQLRTIFISAQQFQVPIEFADKLLNLPPSLKRFETFKKRVLEWSSIYFKPMAVQIGGAVAKNPSIMRNYNNNILSSAVRAVNWAQVGVGSVLGYGVHNAYTWYNQPTKEESLKSLDRENGRVREVGTTDKSSHPLPKYMGDNSPIPTPLSTPRMQPAPTPLARPDPSQFNPPRYRPEPKPMPDNNDDDDGGDDDASDINMDIEGGDDEDFSEIKKIDNPIVIAKIQELLNQCKVTAVYVLKSGKFLVQTVWNDKFTRYAIVSNTTATIGGFIFHYWVAPHFINGIKEVGNTATTVSKAYKEVASDINMALLLGVVGLGIFYMYAK